MGRERRGGGRRGEADSSQSAALEDAVLALLHLLGRLLHVGGQLQVRHAAIERMRAHGCALLEQAGPAGCLVPLHGASDPLLERDLRIIANQSPRLGDIRAGPVHIPRLVRHHLYLGLSSDGRLHKADEVLELVRSAVAQVQHLVAQRGVDSSHHSVGDVIDKCVISGSGAVSVLLYCQAVVDTASKKIFALNHY